MASQLERFAALTARAGDRTVPVEARSAASRELATELGDPRVDVLLGLLATEELPEIRFEAINGLGQLRDVRAFAPLCEIVGNRAESAELRGLAAEMLDFIRGPGLDAVPVLIAALDDPAPMVRYDAAWSLQNLGDKRAIPALMRHRTDPECPYVPDEPVGAVVKDALANVRRRARKSRRQT